MAGRTSEKKMREKPLPHVCIQQTRKWDFPVISPFILRGWQFSTNLMAQRAEPLTHLVPLPNVIHRQEQQRSGCSIAPCTLSPTSPTDRKSFWPDVSVIFVSTHTGKPDCVSYIPRRPPHHNHIFFLPVHCEAFPHTTTR